MAINILVCSLHVLVNQFLSLSLSLSLSHIHTQIHKVQVHILGFILHFLSLKLHHKYIFLGTTKFVEDTLIAAQYSVLCLY